MKDILHLINGQVGKVFITSTHQLLIDRKYIFITKKKQAQSIKIHVHTDSKLVTTPYGQVSFEKIDAEKVEFNDDKDSVFLDFDKLVFPLEIREWQHGDRFQPLGMKHKKKLSDFMIDEKIPLNLKGQVLVLCSEDNLVCVIGYRIDDRYKITKNTRNAFLICNRNSNDQSI